jgi:hypothetical protein
MLARRYGALVQAFGGTGGARTWQLVLTGFVAGVFVTAMFTRCQDSPSTSNASANRPTITLTPPTAEKVSPPTTGPAVNYISPGGPTLALRSFQERFGEVLRFRDLTLYPEYVIAEVVNPQKPDEVDRFTLRAGTFDTPQPVAISSREKLDETTFRGAEFQWEVLAQIAARAPSELAIEGGAVSHVIVDKTGPTGPLLLRAYVHTERRSGMLETDVEGKTMRAVPF